MQVVLMVLRGAEYGSAGREVFCVWQAYSVPSVPFVYVSDFQRPESDSSLELCLDVRAHSSPPLHLTRA
jgi:hypothetical protein